MAVIAENPSLVVHPHPFVGDGRVSVIDAFQERETLGRYIKRTGAIVPAGPVIVWHNGHRVPDQFWRQLIPKTGDLVVIRTRALGGDGGGSKIIRTVAMIALVVVAAWAVGPSALALTGWQAAAVQTGIMIGGSLLINALLPPPTATAAQLGVGSKYESSPTYAIAGGRNRARPWEPMTLIFGQHKVVPDYGAKYYTERVGDDQYLNQVFHFGLQAGAVELSEFKIGDTPISNYQGVQIQTSSTDGKLSMFPGNVDTLQGFALDYAVVNTRTTPLDTSHISVELAAQLFYARDDGGIDGRSVDLRVSYRNVAGGGWTEIGLLSDAIYATHYWALDYVEYIRPDREGNPVGASYGSTNFGDHYEGEEIEVSPGWYDPEYGIIVNRIVGVWHWRPHPFQLGQPWQGVAPDPIIAYSTTPGVRMYGARPEPTYQTVSWGVTPGQYEIMIYKSSSDIKSSRESNSVEVRQILCYQPDNADYTGQLRVALRIKATSQLSGAVDEFSAIASVYCPVWNGSAWVWAFTRNPAWSFLWFARGVYDTTTGNRTYGAGMTTDQLNIDSIKAWGAWCDSKGLTFDYVLDRKMPSAQVLQTIARAGRASPTWQTGKLGVVWDAANLPAVAMFGPFNIKAGSFKVDYINDGTADEIVLNFINPARNWAMDEVRVTVPGATTTNNPLQLDFDGCTNPVMAGREANLLAASQVWHRRRVTWETDIEGWVASRGDVVQMSHDLTVWGYSGRLISRAGNVITLDGLVPSGGSGTLMIRGPENQMRTVTVTSGVGDVNTLTITSDMTGFPLPGDAGYEDVVPMDWAWFFDPLATPGRRFKITEVNPSEDGVKFTAIDDDAGYYASEDNPYLYVPPRDGLLLGGKVFGITFSEAIVNVQSDVTNVQIGWSISAAIPVDVGITINGIARSVVRTTDLQLTIQAQTGDRINVTITPKPKSGSGTPGMQTYVVQGLTAPLPAVTGLTNVFRDGLTVLHWNRVTDIRNPDYEMRIGESWENGRTVGLITDNEALAVGNGLYWVAAHFAARGYVVYGPPDSLSISGATLVRNVLVTVNENPAWDGAVSDGAIINDGLLTLAGTGDFLSVADVLAMDDVLLYGGVISGGAYHTNASNIIDIGYPTPVRVDFEIDEFALNFGENFLTIPDVLTYADVLNVSNRQHYKVHPQIRYAMDDAVFNAWQDYVPGLINARYFDVRLVMETDDSLTVPFVSAFTWTIDVPDVIKRGESVTVPAIGLRITYTDDFHAIPNVQIATFDAVSGDRYVLNNSDKTGFDIRHFNGATAVEREINWISQGY